MLYSNNILKRYLSLPIDVEKIADELTLKSCEVEEIHQRNIPDDVVIGKVTEVKQHPNAEKLSVCQVDCGEKGKYQICCGGENVTTDTYVPVALPGCFLPALNVKIESRELRGKASDGMICSKEELGIPEDMEKHWIWILQAESGKLQATSNRHPELDSGSREVQHEGDSGSSPEGRLRFDFDDITDHDLGTSLGEKYPWLENWTLDVENKTITHRPDMFGHFGLSVELEAIFPGKASFSGGAKYKKQMQEENIFEILENAQQSKRKVKAETDDVFTYTLLEINNVQRARADLYLRTLLYDIEQQPKANRVDFSNIFMYLTGQPVHFFDAKKVEGDIIIRNAHEGEIFVDLFDKEHILIADDIVIADTTKILALAGVVGGNSSGIDETTTNILVEIANFDEVKVRKTGMRLGLRTDAEIRFEKGINPLYSLHVLTMLLDELAYFKKSLGTYEIGGLSRYISDHVQRQVMKRIELDTLKVERMIFGSDGTEVNLTDEKIEQILSSLGCRVSPDRWVRVPAWRGLDDLTLDVDLIEEISRIYGFNQIGEIAYTDETSFVPFELEVVRQRNLENLLVDKLHYDQIETYPWILEKWIKTFDLSTKDLYSMQNPMTPEQKYLRSTMRPSLLESIEKNAPFFAKISLFDIGKTWTIEGGEKSMLALASRQKKSGTWTEDRFLELKGIVDLVLKTLQIKGKLIYELTDISYFHPKQQALIKLNNQTIGTIKTFHPYQAEKCKLPAKGPLSFLELDMQAMSNIAQQQNKKGNGKAKYESLQDQIIWRDLSFVVDEEVSFGIITDALSRVKEVVDIRIFDLYSGEHVAEGEKSITVSIKIVPAGDADLQTKDINEVMDKAISAVGKVGGELRR